MLLRPNAQSLPLLSLLACLAAAGCLSTPPVDRFASLDEPKAIALGDHGPRPVARTLPLEVFFLRCDQGDGRRGEALWSRVDEQMIDDTVRRRLAANGLRAGVLLGQLPEPILAALEPPLSAGEGGPPAPANTADATPPVVRRVLRLLPGRESELVALKAAPDLVVMEQDDEGLHGASYTDALPHFSLRAWPAADGRVRVDLVPVIRHGPLERSWVGEDGAFKLETGQRKMVLDRLRFEVTVPAEGLLVVGQAGSSGASVGDALFRPKSQGVADIRMLALRPLATGVDPMFSPVESGPGADDGGSGGADALSTTPDRPIGGD